MRKSLIDKFSNDDIQHILNTSFSITEVLKKLGYKSFSANRNTVERKISNFNLEQFKINCSIKKKQNINNLRNAKKLSRENLLVENCIHSRKDVKKYILANKLIPYICSGCNNKGEWNNAPLTLQLEHKNGINNDNRIENLCFLCPNCHSQTSTWGSKKRTTKQKYIPQRKFEVEKEELETLLKQMPIVAIAKKFSVTDNAIRRRCKTLKINIPKYPPGYWLNKP